MDLSGRRDNKRRKKSHTKTRLGCQQCKKRRVKCDGNRPTCDNCNGRELNCSFLLLATTSRLSLASASTSENNCPSLRSCSSGSTKTTPPHSDLIIRAKESDPSQSTTIQTTNRRATPAQIEVVPQVSQEVNTILSHPGIDYGKVPIPRFICFNDAWRTVRSPLSSDLRHIFDHFQCTTSQTLSDDTPGRACWQFYIPELASHHEFLVHCMLSIASLHLGHLHGKDNTERIKSMSALATDQLNKGLTRFRNELGNINQNNAAALFVSSTLTAVFLFRTSTIEFNALRADAPTVTPEVISKVTDLALKPIWALRGPLAVVLSSKNWVMSGRVSPIATRKWRWLPKERLLKSEAALEEDSRLEKLERLWSRPGQPTEIHHPFLSDALQQLRETYALHSYLKSFDPLTGIFVPPSVDETSSAGVVDKGAVFVWGTRLSRGFITLLEVRDRSALVILAHWGVLLDRVRGEWWMEDLGFNIVAAVAMNLGPDYMHLIEWPAQCVGLDLKNPLGTREENLEKESDGLTIRIYKPTS